MAAPSTEGFNMDPEVPQPPSVDREAMMAYRWAIGCQEIQLGVVKKSIIRQIWLPDEWLSQEDHEPETSTRHGKETRAPRGGPPATAGLAATSRAAGIRGGEEPVAQGRPTAEAKGEEGEHSSSPVPGGKHSDGSTGAGSNCAFDTSSNSSKGSACSKDAPGSKDASKDSRNVINISSCITGDGSPGKTISLDASINAKPPNRAPTAEEEATAALSAMLGLGKPKAQVAPTPPPRTPLWRPPRSGLNPNAAEFRPMGDGYACASTWRPPPDPVPAPEKEPEDIPEEMSCLLGGSLLDEICGGAAAAAAGAGLQPARASNDAGPEAAAGRKTTTTI